MTVPGHPEVATGAWRRSWFDAFTDWVDAAPRERAWVYLVAWIVALLLLIGPDAVTGGIASVELDLFHIVLAGTAAYMAYFMHVTKRGFDAAMEDLEPLVDLEPVAYARMRRRIVTSPALPTLLFGLGFSVGGSLLLLPLAIRPELDLFGSPWEMVAHGMLLVVTNVVIGTFVCRSIYRIVETRRLHARHLRVDLLRPERLFSQTGVAARGGMSLILYTLAWVATVPGGLDNLGFVALATLINVAAVALYVLPLIRLHGLLVVEKRQRIGAAHDALVALSERLHRAATNDALDEMDGLSKGMAAVKIEIDVLERASTWPWHPELSRVTLTALLVPVLLWSLQRILQGWL